jgi:hypothetical protein
MSLEEIFNFSTSLLHYLFYEWEDKNQELTQRSQMLLPIQDTEMQTLEEAIKTGIETVRSLGIQAPEALKDIDDGKVKPGLVLQAPSIQNVRPSQSNLALQTWTTITSLWRTAKSRLRLFYLASYFISFIVLAGGGFERLYLSKSTFGANTWSDYFSLLALGFGAEATRNVVTQVAGKKEA